MLRDGLVDVAIVMNNPRLTLSSEMVVRSLYTETVEVLMAAGHPLTEYEAIPWTALAEYPHVVFKDGYGMQRLVQNTFAQLGKQFYPALELNTLDAFRGMVRQGKMISILPKSALLDADDTLAVRPIAQDAGCHSLEREVVAVTTQDRLEIPPIAEFFQLVCDKVPPLVAKMFGDPAP